MVMQEVDIEKLKEMGLRIYAARARAGLKQTVLADKIGASASSVTNWENGRHAISPGNLYRLAAVLHTTVDYLVQGNGDPELRIREQTEPYGGIPGARTVKPSSVRIPVAGSVQAGLTEPSRAVITCPHCGKGIDLEGRRRE